MTKTLEDAGGESKPLLFNFRSQPPLIHFCNYLFERLFQAPAEAPESQLEELGYVQHEGSEPKRELRDSGPLVELLVTTKALPEDDPKAEQDSRVLDAEQLARRISTLTQTFPDLKYSDIALLFRAMTQVHIYEGVFRRANIPYQTILGRGFYEREEITDLIQLLRFLDNKTDELALAAILRSPLCGISDNALLALRCGPRSDESSTADPLNGFSVFRKLYTALRRHREIAFISDEEQDLLDRAADLISRLIARRNHYSIEDLLRFAVQESEYMTVIAANFDGAQRLANVQRIFTLAARFEHSGTHLIRDFVRYVEEFEAIGSRESEGQIDEATNAVKLMTIHQAKGLEFPVVIIPDLQRSSRPPENWVLLDRQHGLTLKVPDGRGGSPVAGLTFHRFEKRHAWREQFESMRLLYVAATRAQDRLILSGTTRDLDKLGTRSGTWLNWIWQSLELPAETRTGVVDLTGDLQLQVTLNIADEQPATQPDQTSAAEDVSPETVAATAQSIAQAFPLLSTIEAERSRAIHRFSVTQLINYQRCPRQYYFDRVLHAPAPDALAVWNNAEAPEPPANLTATLKGAVIHRFCETYAVGDDPEERLRKSFADVVRSRQAELADRLVEINVEEAIAELLPLGKNYLASGVFERIERARAALSEPAFGRGPQGEAGLWSELSFRLRRPLGILSGAIDKLLIAPAADGKGFDVEIVDFKTNRLSRRDSTSSLGPRASRPPALHDDTQLGSVNESGRDARGPSKRVEQFAFDFNAPAEKPRVAIPD